MQWLEECSNKKITLSDNSIRSKAKETAKRLHISDEKFKASSGWVENFKTRHGIRAGVWSGAGKLSQPAHILIDGTGEAILSPLNPAFGNRLDGQCDMSPPDDPDLDSDGSPEPEDEDEHQARHQQQIVDSTMMNLQSPWVEQNNGTSSQHTSHSSASSHQSMGHAPIVHHHPAHPGPRLAPLTTQHQHHTQDHEHHHYIEQPPAFYQPTPSVPEPRSLTLADAEDAINTLITYLDSSGQGILEDGERQALNTVKCALFQAASGVPFDRSRQ